MKKNSNNHLAQELVFATMLLCLFGLLAIASASSLKSYHLYQHPYHFVYKQAIAMGGGFFLIYCLYLLPSFKLIQRLTLPFLFVSIAMLSLIYIPGVFQMSGGAKRWISFIGIRFQPAEFAKIAFIFFLAKNLSRPSIHIRSFVSGVLPNFAFLAIFSLLLLKQPDFGSLALIFIVSFLMLFVAGIKKSAIFTTITTSLLLCIYAIFSAPYRLKRLTTFLNPWENAKDGGFQIIQSYLAFYNGQLTGLGLGLSKQKLFFLPEAHTDFILAVIAEEMGFLGVTTLLALFAFISFTGLRITFREKDQFKKFLAFGLSILITCQTFFNVCVVSGLLPTKGISLPFVSSGGSSLLSFLFAIGLLAKIAHLQKEPSSYASSS
jgi:cell division protein FtsW